MVRRITRLFVVVIVAGAGVAATDRALALEGWAPSAEFDAAATLLETKCLRCHSAKRPELGLSLERETLYYATFNVPARSSRLLRLVAPGDPDHSMLYLRLLPPSQGAYRGPQMPMGGKLTEEEIRTVRAWIESLPREPWAAPAPEGASLEPEPLHAPLFFDSFTAHLPTPDTIGHGMAEFRFTHRFKTGAREAGADNLFGLDGGAWISLGLAYGLTDRLDVGLRRSDDLQDYEAYFKAALARQVRGGSPFGIAVQASAIRLDAAGVENRDVWSAQLSVGRRLWERLSFELVPSYAAHTDFLDASIMRGTTALGAAAEFRVKPYLAITGEWIGQIGVKAPYQAGTLGFELRTANHAFHVVLTNVRGTHTNLYLPGGDLDWGEGEFRLGFNISRTIDVLHH
jgi:hypothetical protein